MANCYHSDVRPSAQKKSSSSMPMKMDKPMKKKMKKMMGPSK